LSIKKSIDFFPPSFCGSVLGGGEAKIKCFEFNFSIELLKFVAYFLFIFFFSSKMKIARILGFVFPQITNFGGAKYVTILFSF
jgi:hypothetical protein